jgi:membrane protease YdiL (CAAX protease family)
VLVVFGWVIAWVRARTDSIFPGMAIHSVFNLIALVVAVVPHG